LLGEDRDLGQRLSHDPQQEVVARFHNPGSLPLANVRGSCAEQVQVGAGLLKRLARAGDRQGEPSGLGHLRVAHHRSGEQCGAALGQALAGLLGGLGGAGRAVDHDRRHRWGRGQAPGAEHRVDQIVRPAHRDEDDIGCTQARGRVGDTGPASRERLGFGFRPVVYRQVTSGRQQSQSADWMSRQLTR
jgi:hypothetical protein